MLSHLKKNLLPILAVLLPLLTAAGGTVMSYGALTQRVEGLDQRLARIERFLLDGRTVAGGGAGAGAVAEK